MAISLFDWISTVKTVIEQSKTYVNEPMKVSRSIWCTETAWNGERWTHVIFVWSSNTNDVLQLIVIKSVDR